jgi:hypothetical protein
MPARRALLELYRTSFPPLSFRKPDSGRSPISGNSTARHILIHCSSSTTAFQRLSVSGSSMPRRLMVWRDWRAWDTRLRRSPPCCGGIVRVDRYRENSYLACRSSPQPAVLSSSCWIRGKESAVGSTRSERPCSSYVESTAMRSRGRGRGRGRR